MEQLGDFRVGTTVIFNVTILSGGSAPDITGDTVTITLKTNKDDADPGVLQKDADIATQGSGGIAIFELLPSETAITPGEYFYDIIWETAAGKEYELDSGIVKALKRVSDL
jgi:hypothetical protein